MKATQVIDLTSPQDGELSMHETPTKKRKISSAPSLNNEEKQKAKVGTWDGDGAASSSAKKTKKEPSQTVKNGEKRLRVFRKRAPLTYLTKLERATSQRWIRYIAITVIRIDRLVM